MALDTRRPNWERIRQIAELLISAIGPVAELIDALSRFH
jgi:hypothetical protein